MTLADPEKALRDALHALITVTAGLAQRSDPVDHLIAQMAIHHAEDVLRDTQRV